MKKKLIIVVVLLLLLEGVVATFMIGKYSIMKNRQKTVFKVDEVSTSRQSVLLYQTVIDDIIHADLALVSKANYLSIDLSKTYNVVTGEKLDRKYQEEILAYCQNYSTTIYEKSIDTLQQEGLGTSNQLDGYYLSLQVNRMTKEKVDILAYLYRSPMGSVSNSYLAEYRNGEWLLKSYANMMS